jgi:hypothetical protein
MLGIDADTLRRRTKGREWLEIYGLRIRVYRMDVNPDSERRFDADEIERLLAGMKKAR